LDASWPNGLHSASPVADDLIPICVRRAVSKEAWIDIMAGRKIDAIACMSDHGRYYFRNRREPLTGPIPFAVSQRFTARSRCFRPLFLAVILFDRFRETEEICG
jgi:hypothetical protein